VSTATNATSTTSNATSFWVITRPGQEPSADPDHRLHYYTRAVDNASTPDMITAPWEINPLLYSNHSLFGSLLPALTVAAWREPYPGGTRITPECDSSASFRWIHNTRTVVCTCAAGTWRSKEERCKDIGCSTKEQLQCSTCPSGYFQVAEDAPKCTACAAGRYQPLPGATSCLTCPPSHYQSEGAYGASECSRCPAGYYQRSEGKSYCNSETVHSLYTLHTLHTLYTLHTD
jgi:hypothetical protein